MPETVSPETQALRQALEAAQQRNTQLERNNRELDQRARSATTGQIDAQIHAVDASIEQAKAAQSIARQKWVALQEEGHFEEAGAAMQEMTEASSRLTSLEAQKTYLGQQRENMTRQQSSQSADPLADFSPAERQWISENPAYLSDTTFQSKVNAAANHAEHVLGHARGSEKWFEAINRVAHPDRFEGEGRQRRQSGGQQEQQTDAGEAFSDTGEDNDLPGEHTRTSSLISATPEVPEMRVGQTQGEKPVDPQERAIGRGGNGISATAAAPSRRIAQLAAPMTRGQATLSNEELEAAVEIVGAIEPMNADGTRKTTQQMAETYYAWAHHPSNTSNNRLTGTRRAKNGWSREAIIA